VGEIVAKRSLRGADPLARLHALGFELPAVPTPIANYVPALRHADLVYVSGHGSVGQDEKFYGRVGSDFTLEQGQQAARLAALNCLAALTSLVPLENVRQILKVTGYVHSVDGFTQQPEVLNGASDLLVAIFGEAGKHTRTAIGLRQTARSFTVQMEMLVVVKE
jgi:enamine deaminase RidA (YjgF/YER057c/UK114 family)